ncbi:MAG: lipid-A-disaccharide synthase [Moraxellaceae bacterium]|jgi:lipid-A-disaccharide synthase|nr:lipid-A-disaccharide synthase [Moraxellaceae bacterium]
MARVLRIGIVAGEVSGDTLGAGLIRELKSRFPQAEFVGICGPQMEAEGGRSLFPMERLSVMGLVEVLGRLRELFGIRDALVQQFTEAKIDLFIGIDAPDFNLRLDHLLKPKGIPTVHYVSPSVWAWRQGRVEGIRQAVDLVLCLLPFEKKFYDEHAVQAEFVGHPLADSMPLVHDTQAARRQLGLDADAEYIALLPGSRGGEVSRIAGPLFEAAKLVREKRPQARFIIPAINAARRADIETHLAAAGLEARIFDNSLGAGVGRLVMGSADAVVLASGTATLEAMLLKKPMVVAYRVHWLTYLIARLLVKSRFVTLPNLLADEELVPELIQHAATPQRIAAETLRWLENEKYREGRLRHFAGLHESLRQNADVRAAEAIARLLQSSVEKS